MLNTTQLKQPSTPTNYEQDKLGETMELDDVDHDAEIVEKHVKLTS